MKLFFVEKIKNNKKSYVFGLLLSVLFMVTSQYSDNCFRALADTGWCKFQYSLPFALIVLPFKLVMSGLSAILWGQSWLAIIVGALIFGTIISSLKNILSDLQGYKSSFNRMQFILILLAMVYGWGIWLLSETFTGVSEPWDSKSPYYYSSLFIGGLIFGILGSPHFIIWPVFIYIGQAIFIIYESLKPTADASLVFAGLFLMVFMMVVSLIGSFLGAKLRELVNKFVAK